MFCPCLVCYQNLIASTIYLAKILEFLFAYNFYIVQHFTVPKKLTVNPKSGSRWRPAKANRRQPAGAKRSTHPPSWRHVGGARLVWPQRASVTSRRGSGKIPVRTACPPAAVTGRIRNLDILPFRGPALVAGPTLSDCALAKSSVSQVVHRCIATRRDATRDVAPREKMGDGPGPIRPRPRRHVTLTAGLQSTVEAASEGRELSNWQKLGLAR